VKNLVHIFTIFVVLALAVGCGGDEAMPTPEPTDTSRPAATPTLTMTPPPTATPVSPTDTPAPTRTSTPTDTPQPTDSPTPTLTPVPSETPTPTPPPTLTATPTATPLPTPDLAAGEGVVVMFYGFNTTKPPFDNLLVRQAFALALDRQALAAVVNEWRGSEETIYFPATTMTPPHVLGHDLYGQVGLAYNPDRARALLAQAGYPNGAGLPAVTLYSSDQEQHQLVARAAQAQWRDVLGVEVGLVFVPWGEYHDVVQTDPPQIWRMGWVTEYADPYSFLHDVFCCQAEAVGSERYQTLREAILDETDEAARRALYAEMSSLLCPSWQPTLMRWDNAAYTDLLTRAFHESDAGVRRALYVEAEGILCETETVVIPLYWQ
jgi:ABC-type transport system substrate-binding protein